MTDTKDSPGEGPSEPPILPSTISDEEKELASQSAKDFEAHKFKECLAALNRIAQLRPADNKVKQNKAVVDYYNNGLKFSETYSNNLNSNPSKKNPISDSIDEVEALEDVDHCVHYYNQALLHYHMCQYQAALTIGEKLIQFVVPMEESLARKLCFLMIELHLRTFQPEKALNLLVVAEKLITGGAKGGQSSDKDKGDKAGHGGSGPSDKSDDMTDVWKPRLSLYKARCYIMLRSMKPCKREMKALMTSCSTTQAAIYLKACFAYAARNPRKALKVLNTSLSPGHSDSAPKGSTALPKAISCGESLASMYYNDLGCIYHVLEKHALAAHYFRKSLDEDRKAVNEVRKNMAPSAKGATPPTSFDGIPVYCLGLSHRPAILYNLGIQLLQSGRAQGAFDCLIEAVQVYHSNPRLWLRLAEACMMALRSSNEDSFNISERLRVIEGSVGSGIHRKVIFGRGLSPEYIQGSSADFKTSAIPNATLEFAALCLRNALLLLPSDEQKPEAPPLLTPATSLLDDTKTTPDGATHQTEGPYFLPVPPSNPVRSQGEVVALRSSILAASAYVALSLNDSVIALQHAKTLLAQPKLSGAHKFLGRLYLSEALLNQDNISEAIGYLSPDSVDDVSVSTEGSGMQSSTASSPASSSPSGVAVDLEDVTEAQPKKPEYGSGWQGSRMGRNWWPQDLAKAKGVVYFNLSVAHMVRGENDKARLNLEKVEEMFGGVLPAHFLQSRLYLDLLEGDRAGMQTVLKAHYGHVTGNKNAPDTHAPLLNVKWG